MGRLRSRPSIAIPIIAVWLSACEPAPRALAWSIVFEDPLHRLRAEVVEAEIRRGDCAGEVLYAVEISPGVPMRPTPPVLDPGRYAFLATARDASCVEYAEHCLEVDLPSVAPVELVLVAVPEAPECPVEECAGGRCTGAPIDAGPADAPAELDAPADPCATISCGECEVCDRAAAACVADDGAACTGGTCVGAACCTGCVGTGGCAPGTDVAECGTGGAPCASCATMCAAGACT
jgi:hypothetical protein